MDERRPAVIGFDTSNYRTSVAAVTLDGEVLADFRELLPVPEGERGLRQSDAVFAHVKQLKACETLLRGRADGIRVAAAAASTKPCDGEDSYMPVFRVGETAAAVLAAALNVPLFETTHQRGHLAAAAHGTKLEKRTAFLAPHLSGGTTDLLAVEGERIRRIGGSADLHAGQLVDRAGVALGLPFPSGEHLEKLAAAGRSEGLLGCSLEQGDLVCHLSGAETRVGQWIREKSLSPENAAREIYEMLARTIIRMLRAGARKTGLKEALVTGGVASSPLLRQLLEDRRRRTDGCPELVFGKPERSGDNAVGVALIGAAKLKNSPKGTEE